MVNLFFTQMENLGGSSEHMLKYQGWWNHPINPGWLGVRDRKKPGFYGLGSLIKSMNVRPLKDHASKEIDAENDTQGCPLATLHTIHKL